MAENNRQQSWSEYLDKEKENKLFVRYVFSLGFLSVEEFAVIYLAIMGEKAKEVIRYDCSRDEQVNVHKFFYNPPTKRYLNRDKSFDTVHEFMEDIRKNWRLYRAKFLANKNEIFI